MTRIELAGTFAVTKHGETQRKLPGGGTEPYHAHVLRVGEAVRLAGGSEAAVVAAILHDVVEDTPTTVQEVGEAFGDEIATLVNHLSDKFTPASAPEMNRKARKAAENARVAEAPPEVHLVKLFDLLDNLRDTPPENGFGAQFAEEALTLLGVLRGPEAIRALVAGEAAALRSRHDAIQTAKKAEKAARVAAEKAAADARKAAAQ